VSLQASGAFSLRVCLSLAADDAISLVLADESGALVASVGSLHTRSVSLEQLGGARGAYRESLFCVDWVAVSLGLDPLAAGDWALLDAGERDGTGVARGRLVEDLRVAGVLDGVVAYGDLRSLGEAVDGGSQLPRMVVVDLSAGALEGSSLPGLVHVAVKRALALVQAWLSDERFSGSRLVFVTRGAVAVGVSERVAGLAQAGVWGLVRSAQSENPDRFVLVDLDEHEGSLRALPAVLAGALSLDEPQLALREGIALAARLGRVGSDGALEAPAGVEQWRLDAGGGGTLEDLSLVPCPEAAEALGVGEVRIGVRAGGLNFRDVLVALGVVQGVGVVGTEGAGVVIEVGPEVTGLAVGDRVMGLLAGGFGPVAVTDHRLVVRVPDGWSFVEAASVPIVFLTAYYALVDLARLQPGERLLVHAAAGGVGMAAVALAKHLGAGVFGTASPGKWEALRSLGLDEAHIASSRTLEFKERFLDATGGRGMDVVLDSLAGEFVDASLELLPGGGRFLEMGKTDIRDPVAVAGQYPGAVYQAFDLMEAGLERIHEMLGELLGLFHSGVLEPLPVRTWDVRRAPEAFRFMSQARHVGKIVLSLPAVLGTEGTVLITGGTGDLGALVAKHLVAEHGIRSVLLASRRGPEAQGAPELQAELAGLGAQVRIAACDVSDRGELEALLESAPAEYPLSGIVHAAGVLDDGVVESLTAERVDRVLAAKVDAAWHLQELTGHLQMFVLFSSMAGTFGSPGQGNYAAANAFLDALAAHRRSQGLAGISMAWGAWEQTNGMTKQLNDSDFKRMTRSGIAPLSPKQGLELFDAANTMSDALVLPIALDLMSLRTHARTGTLPPLLRRLIHTPARKARDGATQSLARRLANTPEDQRENLVLELVRSETATVLGHASPHAVEPQRAFKDLGLDSLAAVELRNRLNQATGLRLPTTLIFDHPTPTAVAECLLDELVQDEMAAAGGHT
jgi:NADPH:quinone reductase-like Zn-dependent oxidoreductase/acyl carrier protein